MSWDWSRSATWSSSSPADQLRSMWKPRPPLRVAAVGDEEHDRDEDAEKEGEEDTGGGGDEGWRPSASVTGDARPARGRRRRRDVERKAAAWGGGKARGARRDLGGLRTGGGLARGGAGTGRDCSRRRERGRVWIRGGFILYQGGRVDCWPSDAIRRPVEFASGPQWGGQFCPLPCIGSGAHGEEFSLSCVK
jgi:hypothetical protein